MKKMILLLILVSLNFSCGVINEPKPYEATWLELEVTDNGYVVFNYPSRWDDGKTIAPISITIRSDSLIWETFYEPAAKLSLKNVSVEKRDDGSYFFPIGNLFLFTWYDKEKHIAQWKIFDTMESVEKDEPRTFYLYVDSRYNTFPIIDFDWGEERPATGEAD